MDLPGENLKSLSLVEEVAPHPTADPTSPACSTQDSSGPRSTQERVCCCCEREKAEKISCYGEGIDGKDTTY
jgi:hypothetical protein